MKQLVIILVNLLCTYALFAQKKPIDSAAYSNWRQLYNPYLTADGKYVCYSLTTSDKRDYSVNLVSADGKWSKSLPGVMMGELAGNDAYYLVKRADTLNFLQLGTDKEESFKVVTYNIPDRAGKNLLFFQDLASGNDLSFKNINNPAVSHIRNVGTISSYHYFPGMNAVLLKTESDSAGKFDLKLADLSTFQVRTLMENCSINAILEDTLHNQVGIFTNEGIWNYKCNNAVPEKIIEKDKTIEDCHLYYPLRYSRDGEYIFLIYQPVDEIKKANLPDVSIWSYKDLPEEYNRMGYGVKTIWARLRIRDHKLILLNRDEKSRFQMLNTAADTLGIAAKISFSLDRSYHSNITLISIVDGKELSSSDYGFILSPDEQYLVYSDETNYYTYEVRTGLIRNLTKDIHNNWKKNDNGDYDFLGAAGGIVGWGKDDKTVYVSDQYDIWKLDLTGNGNSACLTNQYGRRNKIIFTLVDDLTNMYSGNPNIIKAGTKIVFSAFNTINKQNGFYYKKNIGTQGDPVELLMEDATYWTPALSASFPGSTGSLRKPVKAKDANVYLMVRSTVTQSPNLFTTKDFKHFTQLTHQYPERNYNWYTTELVNWQTSSGIDLQGVLYKPENFDAAKKYPLIFYHYRKASANLNTYIVPQQYPGCIIDIPTYVSNGYLVFTPDIYFTKGETGKSALEALVSAAEKLSERPYIDSTKLGVQGCSFSGFTTNYIVTHTGKFTAAVSASGLSDLISAYNSINAGDVKQGQFEEKGPYQMGNTLWEDPQAYIRNSPVFNMPQLTTPLLLMHTVNDYTVPFANGLEFYLAGKRLGKKIWLLEYGNNNSHVVMGKEGRDFNTRMMQFFNHYLKGAPPPRWLTEGRPAKLKDSDPALDLDSSGRVP